MNKKEFITDLIKERQSIYPLQYTGEKIDQDTLKWLFENAIDAPSHAKTNPWRFHVIPQEKLSEWTTFFEDTYRSEIPAERFNERRFNAFGKKLAKTSHLVVLTMVRDEKERIPEWEEVAAMSMAVQNIYLSITAAGLAGYWASPGFIIRNIEKMISLGDREKCFGFFYLGIPVAELPPKPEKGSVDDYVKWY